MVDGRAVAAELVSLPGTGVRHLIAAGASHPFLAEAGDRKGRWQISLGGARFAVDAVDERTRAIREMTGAGEEETQKVVAAPMPGLVVKVQVEVGQQVRAGQGLVIVEAMKMENELKAPADGVVARIDVEPGRTVDKGATLIVLE
jgi:pyruvate carboxylase subunit B